ncbi:hypothetical protein VTO42DRAFT_5362 [Malbranchea cinnamomea]
MRPLERTPRSVLRICRAIDHVVLRLQTVSVCGRSVAGDRERENKAARPKTSKQYIGLCPTRKTHGSAVSARASGSLVSLTLWHRSHSKTSSHPPGRWCDCFPLPLWSRPSSGFAREPGSKERQSCGQFTVAHLSRRCSSKRQPAVR